MPLWTMKSDSTHLRIHDAGKFPKRERSAVLAPDVVENHSQQASEVEGIHTLCTAGRQEVPMSPSLSGALSRVRKERVRLASTRGFPSLDSILIMLKAYDDLLRFTCLVATEKLHHGMTASNRNTIAMFKKGGMKDVFSGRCAKS